MHFKIEFGSNKNLKFRHLEELDQLLHDIPLPEDVHEATAWVELMNGALQNLEQTKQTQSPTIDINTNFDTIVARLNQCVSMLDDQATEIDQLKVDLNSTLDANYHKLKSVNKKIEKLRDELSDTTQSQRDSIQELIQSVEQAKQKKSFFR